MIRIRTLGGLAVTGDDGNPLAGPATQPRRLAILALLARAGERGMSRDKILALLWPDADDDRGARSLTQAIYALRKDLSTEDVIVGSKELRLDSALVASDIAELASAVSRGDDARAVALYAGPFLDGFHLAGAEDFSRWVETERAAIAHDYVRSLEALARAALIRGDGPAAVTWWRKVTALDPLNARFTIGLMEALVAAGDRAGAIKQAHVYQLLVDQELDLPPDREVMALAERLRESGGQPAATRSPVPVAPASSPAPVVAQPEAEPAASPPDPPPVAVTDPGLGRPRASVRQHPRVVRVAGAIVLAGIAGLAGLAGLHARRNARGGDGGNSTAMTGPVIAVGQVASYGTDSVARGLAGPVSDLLSTSLARVSTLRVVSRGRLLELMRAAQPNGAPDTSAGGFVNAARRASASEIIEGTVYVREGGRLRLDLRRIDLATGAIGDVHTVEGSDLFTLVDSGTARLVAAFGARGPEGSVAEVTTRSVTAYRMYERGIRSYYNGDFRTALSYFEGALAEDSLFALATYWSALAGVQSNADSTLVRLARARRLAARAPDRERLTILAGWAHAMSSPELPYLADTLVTRYPTEVEGYLYRGVARVNEGDFLGAIEPLERAVAMDSSGMRNIGASCRGCEAMRWLVSAYELADSFPAAERVARRWVRLQPGTVPATNTLAETIDAQGRFAEADSVFHTAAPTDPAYSDVLPFRAMHLIRAGDYEAADRLLVSETKLPGARRQVDALWLLAISLREQGRLADAIEATRRIRPLARQAIPTGNPLSPSVLEAQLQLESSRPSVAVALLDSILSWHDRDSAPSAVARNRAWLLTHAANAYAAQRDTAALRTLADSVLRFGNASGFGRDRRLVHHVRGLLLAARGDDAGAMREFRSAIYSVGSGYTRTNYELARLLLRHHQPREAVALLQPAFRGGIDAANLYVNRIELHAMLAAAWDSVGVRDSAATHYAVVAHAWSHGDQQFRARADSARSKVLTDQADSLNRRR